MDSVITITRRNRTCSTSNSSYSYTFICRLSRLCTLHKPFDRFRCHLAGTIWGGVQCHIVLDGVPGPPGEGEIWGFWPKHAISNCSQTVSPMLPPGENEELGELPQWFRLLPNYFGSCYICFCFSGQFVHNCSRSGKVHKCHLLGIVGAGLYVYQNNRFDWYISVYLSRVITV